MLLCPEKANPASPPPPANTNQDVHNPTHSLNFSSLCVAGIGCLR